MSISIQPVGDIARCLEQVNMSRASQGVSYKYICISEDGLVITDNKEQRAQIQDIEKFIAQRFEDKGFSIGCGDKTSLEGQLSLLHIRTWKSLSWLGLAWIKYLFIEKVGRRLLRPYLWQSQPKCLFLSSGRKIAN